VTVSALDSMHLQLQLEYETKMRENAALAMVLEASRINNNNNIRNDNDNISDKKVERHSFFTPYYIGRCFNHCFGNFCCSRGTFYPQQ